MNYPTTDLGLLILRLTSGLSMLILHGVEKLKDPSAIVEVLKQSGFPLAKFMAFLSISAETIFPIMIILGILTRISSLVASINMFVAGIVFHLIIRGDQFPNFEKAYLYFIIYAVLVITGPGKYTIDRFLGKN